MNHAREFAVAAVAAALLGFVLPAQNVHSQAEEGSIGTSRLAMVVGGDPTIIEGSGFISCAGDTPVVGLIFPGFNSAGYDSPAAAEFTWSSPVTVDDSGGFQTEVPGLSEFPGTWFGYFAMRDDCVRNGPLHLLADVDVLAPAGEASGDAVIIPAVNVGQLPIMADDSVRDPYLKLAPVAITGSDGRECYSAGVLPVAANGDVVIPTIDCAEGIATMSVGDTRVTLLDPVYVKRGFQSAVRLTFPPPESGPAMPLPPATGEGASENRVSPVGLLFLLFGAVLLIVGFGPALFRGRGRKQHSNGIDT